MYVKIHKLKKKKRKTKQNKKSSVLHCYLIYTLHFKFIFKSQALIPVPKISDRNLQVWFYIPLFLI